MRGTILAQERVAAAQHVGEGNVCKSSKHYVLKCFFYNILK
jgi:hypothetical protein